MIRKIYISAFCTGLLYITVNIAITGLFLKEAKAMASACPYQIGLMKTQQIPCFTTGYPPVCKGGILCPAKDVGTCKLYSEVTGAPSGGMGFNALFLKKSIIAAKLVPGGSLISCGLGPTLMDFGPLATSGGGCVNCVGKAEAYSKALARLNQVNGTILSFIDRIFEVI